MQPNRDTHAKRGNIIIEINHNCMFQLTNFSNYCTLPTHDIFFLCCGPMQNGFSCEYIEAVARTVSANYIDLQNILNNSTDLGCEGHPSASGQQKIADKIIPRVKDVMGW